MASKLTISGNVGGVQLRGSFTRDVEGGVNETVPLPAGFAGTLSTRTDNDTGTLTLAAGHGITTGATVGVFWAGGYRVGMTVGTVSGQSVPIDLGTGANLPAPDTAVVCSVVVPISIHFDGSTLVMFVAVCGKAAYLDVLDQAGEGLTTLLPAGEPYLYVDGFNMDNVFQGKYPEIAHACNATTEAATLVIGAALDSVP